MKTTRRFAYIAAGALAALLAVLGPQTAGAEDAATKLASTKLAALGFHTFKTPQPLPPGTVTPLNAAEGPTLAIDKLKGTVTVLNFWATWCPPCRNEMPSIQRLADLMKGTAFRVVAVSVGEDRKTVAAFIKENGYTYPIYLDERGTLSQSLASQGIPTTYILDKNGMVIAGTVGSREYDEPALVAALKELAAK
jgi:thiol-disulfide isomerase/thioredoxin